MSASNSSSGVPIKTPSIASFTEETVAALNAAQDIKNNVHKLLELFTLWKSQEPESSINSVKDTIKVIQNCQSKLEKTAMSHQKLPDMQPVSLGNAGLITLDSGEDKLTLYKDLLQAYSWVSKLNIDANRALSKLKRKYPEPEQLPTDEIKRPKDTMRFLRDFCPILQSHCPDLSISVPNTNIPCLQIVLNGVMCALVVICGRSLDRVIIRSDCEKITNASNSTLDLWTSSQYTTFQQITDAAQAAMLNFLSLEIEQSLKEFVKWLSSYKTLFSDKCRLCKKHLKSDTSEGHLLPPCWRDILTGEPYHMTCR